MRILGLVLAALLSACGGEDPGIGWNPQPISRGTPDATASGVIMVIDTERSSLCSGVVVTPRLVLTARHCVAQVSGPEVIDCPTAAFGTLSHADAIYVLTAPDTAVPEKRHAVVRVLAPKDPSFCGGDLAALVLGDPLPEEEASPVPIRTDGEVMTREAFGAVGFGRDGSAASGMRRRRDDLHVSCVGRACRSARVTEGEWLGEGGVCAGDSGGPALDSEGRVIGIASRRRDGCSATVYMSVSASNEFVASALGIAARTPPAVHSSCELARSGSPWPFAGIGLLLLMRVRGASRRERPR